MSETITCYHGTDSKNVDNIKQNNFILKHDKSHWLGDGIYFFINGIGEDAITLSSKWAIAESWNNEDQCRYYDNFSVLKTDISLDNISILDLTDETGLDIYNRFRRQLLETLYSFELKEKYSGNKGFEYDFKLFQHIKNHSSVGLIISHIYIKFTKERKAKVRSRIPNCTIVSVANKKNIDKESIVVVKKGRVNDG
jgi:hypothetical protein